MTVATTIITTTTTTTTTTHITGSDQRYLWHSRNSHYPFGIRVARLGRGFCFFPDRKSANACIFVILLSCYSDGRFGGKRRARSSLFRYFYVAQFRAQTSVREGKNGALRSRNHGNDALQAHDLVVTRCGGDPTCAHWTYNNNFSPPNYNIKNNSQCALSEMYNIIICIWDPSYMGIWRV